MEGRTFTVTIRDSVEDYTQLMKEIFDFDLLKKLINGTDDQPPFKFVASAMYGGEVYTVDSDILNSHTQSLSFFLPFLPPMLQLIFLPVNLNSSTVNINLFTLLLLGPFPTLFTCNCRVTYSSQPITHDQLSLLPDPRSQPIYIVRPCLMEDVLLYFYFSVY